MSSSSSLVITSSIDKFSSWLSSVSAWIWSSFNMILYLFSSNFCFNILIFMDYFSKICSEININFDNVLPQLFLATIACGFWSNLLDSLNKAWNPFACLFVISDIFTTKTSQFSNLSVSTTDISTDYIFLPCFSVTSKNLLFISLTFIPPAFKWEIEFWIPDIIESRLSLILVFVYTLF